MQALALADDTTGALEVGAQFAAAGVRAAVALESDPDLGLLGHYTALVTDTATRHLAAAEARERVGRLCAAARARGDFCLYKKTDSTLRGPIGAEFEALIEVWPERPLVYVPAYPAMGRQVIGGNLLVDGRPLNQTAFAGDPLEPALESSIPRLLGRTCRARVILVRSAAQLAGLLGNNLMGAVLVCDGREEADLEAVAVALASSPHPPLVAGTGGFAGHWIRTLPLERGPAPARPAARRWLVVNGSLHPRSLEQIEHSGLPWVSWQECDLPDSPWVVLRMPREHTGKPLEMAAQMGEAVRRIARRNAVDGLVIFGGDTVRAALCALGAGLLEPCGELLAGVPISRAPAAGLVLVTKAGGFGPPDLLTLIRNQVGG